jgi:CDP-diacylglycerol--inositol 3-phosphatidyltransferase
MNKIKKNNLLKIKFFKKSSLIGHNKANQPPKKMPAWRIYLLIPNLIGYLRILLVVIAFWICFKQPYLFLGCYGLSQLLDALDGYAARYFRQSTKYGAMLDMVTDRGSTAALLIALTKLYPAYTRLFMAIIVLDIVSHFAYIYSSLIYGKASHKLVSAQQNQLLRIYYSYKWVLFLFCLGNESYLLFLYNKFFNPMVGIAGLAGGLETMGIKIVSVALCLLFACKQIINVIQLIQAAQDTVKFDRLEWGGQKPSDERIVE